MVRALETICIVVLGLTACYEPPQPDCGFYCGAGSTCPENYTCTTDNRCRRMGAPASATCEPDAGVVGRDVGGFDVPVVDNTPPMVDFTSPTGGSTNVSVNVAILVSFSEPVFNVSSLTFSAFLDGSTVVQGTLAAVGAPPTYATYQLTPSSPLPAGTSVTVSLTNQIYDNAGNSLVTPGTGQYLFSFMTAP